MLSGRGKGAEVLRTLWHAAKNGVAPDTFVIGMRTEPEAFESIGGTPLLVRNGKPAYDNASTAFVQAQHPRTIVGWTKFPRARSPSARPTRSMSSSRPGSSPGRW